MAKFYEINLLQEYHGMHLKQYCECNLKQYCECNRSSDCLAIFGYILLMSNNQCIQINESYQKINEPYH